MSIVFVIQFYHLLIDFRKWQHFRIARRNIYNHGKILAHDGATYAFILSCLSEQQISVKEII